MEESKKPKSGSAIGGIVLAGCTFIGSGIGMMFHEKEAGVALGMGIGLIAMGAIWAYYRNK